MQLLFRTRLALTPLTLAALIVLIAAGLHAAEASRPVQPSRDNQAFLQARPNDWPWWRGPTLDGKSPDADPPLNWTEQKNILWRTPLTGRGHASPVVYGDHIYLANADEVKKLLVLECFARADGRRLWTKVIHQGELMHRHTKNSHASATPACDGRRLYLVFITGDALWVTATDLAGNLLWQKEAGKFVSQHGYGSSPVLYGDMVIVAADNAGPGYLVALRRDTGDVVWRTPRSDSTSYSTPIVAQVAGRPQLLLSGIGQISSYDPATGERLWFAKGPTDVTACTMTHDNDLVFVTGGFPGKEIQAIRADGSGDVSETHVVWRTKTGVSYVPSPLVDRGLLYIVNDQGIATCFEATTGKVHWRKRLGGNFTSSPVLAAGKIYVSNEEGTTLVLRAGTEFEQLAENKLPDGQFATPAIIGNRIYVRGTEFLYCVGGDGEMARR